MSDRTVGYLWLVAMAMLLAVGGYTDTRWMTESAVAGFAGFVAGWYFGGRRAE